MNIPQYYIIPLVLVMLLIPALYLEYGASEVNQPSTGSDEGTSSGAFSSGSGLALKAPSLSGDPISYCASYSCSNEHYYRGTCYYPDGTKEKAECSAYTDTKTKAYKENFNLAIYVQKEFQVLLARLGY